MRQKHILTCDGSTFLLRIHEMCDFHHFLFGLFSIHPIIISSPTSSCCYISGSKQPRFSRHRRADAAREEDATPLYSTATSSHPSIGQARWSQGLQLASLCAAAGASSPGLEDWNYARGAATASSGVGPRAAAESCT